MKHGVNNSSRMFCKRHELFYPSNEVCNYCVAVPLAETLPKVAETVVHREVCKTCGPPFCLCKTYSFYTKP